MTKTAKHYLITGENNEPLAVIQAVKDYQVIPMANKAIKELTSDSDQTREDFDGELTLIHENRLYKATPIKLLK